MSPDAQLQLVVDSGCCIGCGACAVRSADGVAIELDARGLYQARVRHPGGAPDDFAAICPFSGQSADEDQIADERFADARRHEGVGRHLACYAGHVADPGYRDHGSSGGFVSWLLDRLFAEGIIDGVVHVRADAGKLGFRYDISTAPADMRARSKSRYYPVTMAEALLQLRALPGRYALVGVPCFVKATHLLAAADPRLAERIAVRLAIVCGHLKSARFADYLALRCGVEPGHASGIDFRHKFPGRHAGAYGVAVETRDTTVIKPMSEIYGNNWGYGFFKYPACDYCDDVVGETAEVSIGDAWLPGYVDDGLGANVVVARDARIRDLIERGRSENRLAFDAVGAATVAKSQEAGLRDRREGLAWRLATRDEAGEWRPRKRVEASLAASGRRRRIYRLRQQIMVASHSAYAAAAQRGSLEIFDRLLHPLTEAYDRLYRPSLPVHVLGLARRLARKVVRMIPWTAQ